MARNIATNTLTAREFLEHRNFSSEELLDWDVAEEYLIDFAKFHAEAIIKDTNELLVKESMIIEYADSLSNIK